MNRLRNSYFPLHFFQKLQNRTLFPVWVCFSFACLIAYNPTRLLSIAANMSEHTHKPYTQLWIECEIIWIRVRNWKMNWWSKQFNLYVCRSWSSKYITTVSARKMHRLNCSCYVCTLLFVHLVFFLSFICLRCFRLFTIETH